MNPQSNEAPKLNLPAPVTEQPPVGPTNPEAARLSPEQAISSAQTDPTRVQPPAAPAAAIPLPTMPLTGPMMPQSGVGSTTQTVVPVAADDADLIEKEWVSKAKEIVERTRENPYQQSKELNLFKADYMKKRYNKTLKISE